LLQLVIGVPFSRLESTYQEGGLHALGIFVFVAVSFVAFIAALFCFIAGVWWLYGHRF
jgi:hypothetical protein